MIKIKKQTRENLQNRCCLISYLKITEMLGEETDGKFPIRRASVFFNASCNTTPVPPLINTSRKKKWWRIEYSYFTCRVMWICYSLSVTNYWLSQRTEKKKKKHLQIAKIFQVTQFLLDDFLDLVVAEFPIHWNTSIFNNYIDIL